MKIAVYGVAKNEELNVADWYESSKDADYHFILDTGSTDNTITVAKNLGINVTSGFFNPWNESMAKNTALSLLPQDIDLCILLDIDQRMSTKNWKQILLSFQTLEYDAIEHYTADTLDIRNIDLHRRRSVAIHKRKNCYWDKYRPRLMFYSSNPKILRSELEILGGYGANEERFNSRENLYLNTFEIEYQKILNESEESRIAYFLEIIAHQAFNFFETNDFIKFLNKEKEFYEIYNKLSKDDKKNYSYLDDYLGRFLLAKAILNPKNAYEILSNVSYTSGIKKTALLKQNIIMFWLGKEKLVEELLNLPNSELISIYADTKTGKFKFDLAEISYNYFINHKV